MNHGAGRGLPRYSPECFFTDFGQFLKKGFLFVRHNKARYLLYFVLAVLAVSALLTAKAHFDPSIHFLPRHSNASWILLPQEFNLYLNRHQTRITAFRTRVNIEKKIIKPELNIRAFKSGKLFINGNLIQKMLAPCYFYIWPFRSTARSKQRTPWDCQNCVPFLQPCRTWQDEPSKR